MSKANWIKLTSSSRRKLQERMKIAPRLGGTVFDSGFYMALKLDPIPTTIFFMTDGSCSESRGIDRIEKLWAQAKRLHGAKNMPLINTVGLDVGVKKTTFWDLSKKEQKEILDAEKEKMEKMDSKRARAYKKEKEAEREEEKRKWEKNKGKGDQDPESMGSGKHLMDIAKLGGGEAVFLSGESYMKEYGQDKSVNWNSVGKRIADSDSAVKYMDVKLKQERTTKYFAFDDLEAE